MDALTAYSNTSNATKSFWKRKEGKTKRKEAESLVADLNKAYESVSSEYNVIVSKIASANV